MIIAGILAIVFIKVILSVILIVEVRGSSMEPTLCDGDIILINRFLLKKNIRKGDIVIFQRGSEPKYIIKRILECPFNTVVYENRLGQDTLILDRNEYFVAGDNKGSSIDSRNYGPINREQIIGRKLIVIR